ncbi:MAG TPA: acylphosphatase [Candidatus Nanoarchaeia archaeon]|nr:acylphosphatase [Candidatus Nanoarchaeia archaeon]
MRLHAFVSGSVQGVFFRSNTVLVAKRLGLVGFVKNLVDGRVEVDAYSSKPKLDELLSFINKNPGASKVTNINFKFSDENVSPSSFVVA